MTQFFMIMGRLTGRALKSHVVDRAVTSAAGFVASEVRLADIRLKQAFLRRKRNNHLTILGRTVYRLLKNNINPASDARVASITRVLGEIDGEIDTVENNLRQRKEYERRKKNNRENTRASNRGSEKK